MIHKIKSVNVRVMILLTLKITTNRGKKNIYKQTRYKQTRYKQTHNDQDLE